jgi:hypothetical protein
MSEEVKHSEVMEEMQRRLKAATFKDFTAFESIENHSVPGLMDQLLSQANAVNEWVGVEKGECEDALEIC